MRKLTQVLGVVLVLVVAGAGNSSGLTRIGRNPPPKTLTIGARAEPNVRTNSVLDVPVAPTDSGLPVLISNHGGFWTRWSATFVTEGLDPTRAHELIRSYTLAFFDQYLGGKPSNLLSDTGPRMPEVVFGARRSAVNT